VKHLSLYVIATVNTAPTVRPAAERPRRARRHFTGRAWLRSFKGRLSPRVVTGGDSANEPYPDRNNGA
jgi:hypothetical protein